MGLVGWVKGMVIRREASKAGARFAEGGGAVLDLLKRHKAKVGAITAGVAAWCAAGCGDISVATIFALVGIPITGTAVVSPLDLIQRIPVLGNATCGHVTFAIGVVGAFLFGAGVMTSDKHEAVIQGVTAPTGPPAVLPPAEIARLKEEPKG